MEGRDGHERKVPGTELGDRYRTANDLAARFVRRLLGCGPLSTHATLRRFYRAGQAEKIIEVQGKVSELLGISLDPASDEHESES